MGYQAEELRLEIEGMHCASCATRVERGLNQLDGVAASVNYLTEQATVHCPPDTPVERLIGAVEAAGYRARRAPAATTITTSPGGLSRRLAVAILLSVPVVLLGMFTQLRFARWEWVALALSTPVVFYSGWSLHRVGACRARGTARRRWTRSISLGTLAAWSWSAVVLVARHSTPTRTSTWPP